ncbi:MAG: DUF3253 domain-containing protein [Rhodospirillales bacterium]|nr:DUF3253 domain-containing protein [Rhodospirillales bacterium]
MPSPEAPGKPAEAGEDPVALAILELLAAGDRSVSPEQAARAFAATRAKPSDPPDLWRRYLHAVRQQGLHLARQGRIAILRKGKPVDPNKPVKGVIRLARPRPTT